MFNNDDKFICFCIENVNKYFGGHASSKNNVLSERKQPMEYTHNWLGTYKSHHVQKSYDSKKRSDSCQFLRERERVHTSLNYQMFDRANVEFCKSWHDDEVYLFFVHIKSNIKIFETFKLLSINLSVLQLIDCLLIYSFRNECSTIDGFSFKISWKSLR